jgi:hypothetical protein
MALSPDGSIAARMADHYERQLAWVRAAIASIDSMSAMPPDADWDAAIADDARRARDLRELDAEYVALRKEWDAIPAFLPDERKAVRELALRVKALGEEYDTKLDALLAKFAQAGSGLQAEMGALRKTRDVLQKFAAGPPPGGGFVDRRA